MANAKEVIDHSWERMKLAEWFYKDNEYFSWERAYADADAVLALLQQEDTGWVVDFSIPGGENEVLIVRCSLDSKNVET